MVQPTEEGFGGSAAVSQRHSSEGGVAPLARGAGPRHGLLLGPAHEGREWSVRTSDGGP
jgi:hypothetical protein